MFKIALTWPVTRTEVVRFKAHMKSECDVLSPSSFRVEELLKIAKDADAIVGPYVPQEMIDEAKGLKMVQLLHSGVAQSTLGGQDLGFSFDSLRSRNIILGNIAGANAVSVAEHAFALMITLAKKILPTHRAISRGKWHPFNQETLGSELAYKTLGIIGLGAIGVEVAKRARGFDMRILATKKTPESHFVGELGLDFLGTPEDLHKVLADSDFVILSLPLTPTTEDLIGENELNLMKKSAYLVNVARASLIDEQALYQALTKKWIAGFATDVWWIYSFRPKPSDSGIKLGAAGIGGLDSFWRSPTNMGIHAPSISHTGIHRLDNVVLSGDRACWNADVLRNFPLAALKNVDMLAMGQTPKQVVDLHTYAL